jgi:hypothetical protein
MKKALVSFLILYSSGLFALLLINFKNDPAEKAMMLMGLGLFLLWVLVGGFTQLRILKKKMIELTRLPHRPILMFSIFAIVLACIEEAIATAITNTAPLLGVSEKAVHITASTNYFHVIFFHSVIAFIPMFITLGWLLKKYDISPFRAFVIFGLVGVLAEFTLAGPMVMINAPFWILVYGLMVYLPSHLFAHTARKHLALYLYPLLIPLIAFSTVCIVWLPILLDKGPHF